MELIPLLSENLYEFSPLSTEFGTMLFLMFCLFLYYAENIATSWNVPGEY